MRDQLLKDKHTLQTRDWPAASTQAGGLLTIKQRSLPELKGLDTLTVKIQHTSTWLPPRLPTARTMLCSAVGGFTASCSALCKTCLHRRLLMPAQAVLQTACACPSTPGSSNKVVTELLQQQASVLQKYP